MDLQQAQESLWYRYKLEKDSVQNDFDSKYIEENIYAERMKDLRERYNKPYKKLNDELKFIRNEIKGQIYDVKANMQCQIHKMEDKISELKHNMICKFLSQNDNTENSKRNVSFSIEI